MHILVHCHRCHRVFKTETELREHQRATEPCIVSNRDPPEGIDTAQLARLKSKKRFGKERTEEEKWRAIYHFLFPEEDATLVSPCTSIKCQCVAVTSNTDMCRLRRLYRCARANPCPTNGLRDLLPIRIPSKNQTRT